MVGSGSQGQWVRVLVIVAAATMLFACQGRHEETSGPTASTDAGPRAVEPQASPAQAPAAPVPEATIEVGEATRISSQLVAVPLAFYAADSHDVGRIHAEISVPEGRYKLSKAEPSEKRRWKISAKENGSLIELDVSGGDRAISDGEVGRLVFALPEGSAPDRVPLTINHVHTQPPQAESEQSKSNGELPAAPDSSAPSPGCFFFTH